MSHEGKQCLQCMELAPSGISRRSEVLGRICGCFSYVDRLGFASWVKVRVRVNSLGLGLIT